MKTQELSFEEMKTVNGGGLLGGDSMSSLTGILQGYINVSHTDEDGDTESYNADFGLGSIFQGQNDD